jgi:hypothetical protein
MPHPSHHIRGIHRISSKLLDANSSYFSRPARLSNIKITFRTAVRFHFHDSAVEFGARGTLGDTDNRRALQPFAQQLIYTRPARLVESRSGSVEKKPSELLPQCYLASESCSAGSSADEKRWSCRH